MLDEVTEFVDMIYSQDTTARHLARRMYRFFVRYEINQEIEDDIIGPLAVNLMQNNFEIKPALRLLLGSQHFFDEDDGNSSDEVIGSLIKSPLDLQLSILKFWEVPVPSMSLDPFENLVTFFGPVKEALSLACFDLFEPPEVAGYQPVYQGPEYNRLWISAKSIPPRYQMADELISGPAG